MLKVSTVNLYAEQKSCVPLGIMDPRAIVNGRKMFVSLSEYGKLVPVNIRNEAILFFGMVMLHAYSIYWMSPFYLVKRWIYGQRVVWEGKHLWISDVRGYQKLLILYDGSGH